MTSSRKVEDIDVGASIIGEPVPRHQADVNSTVVETEVVEIIESDDEDDDDVIMHEVSDSQSDSELSSGDIYSDNLSHLADLDSLLQQDLVGPATTLSSTAVTTTSISKEPSTNFSNVSIVQKGLKTPDSPVMNLDPFDLSLTASPDDFFRLDADMGFIGSKAPSSFSDSGYSEVSSPHSDVSSSLLDDDVWEESFTELFPSLM